MTIHAFSQFILTASERCLFKFFLIAIMNIVAKLSPLAEDSEVTYEAGAVL